MFQVGDKVRVIATPAPTLFPVGTEGVIREVILRDFLFVELPSLERPLYNGDGYALTSDEVEKV